MVEDVRVESMLLVTIMNANVTSLDIANITTSLDIANITTNAGKKVFNPEEKKVTWLLINMRKENVETMKGPMYLDPDAAVLSGCDEERRV